MTLECSKERPWGVHLTVFSDQDCARCGWTAPGPIGDALAEALEAAAEARARAEALGWQVLKGGKEGDALAA